MESTLLYDYCCNSTSSLVDSGFKNLTDSPTVRISLQLKHFSLQEDSIQEIIDTNLLQSRYFAVQSLSTPFFRHETQIGELLLYSVRVCLREITLVDGYNDRNLCSFSMVDGFPCLRHDTVVCRNNKYYDICNLSSSGSHHTECSVTRSIQEYDFTLIRNSYFISTYMLCNTTVLTSYNVCTSNGVKCLCLTMVYVTHNSDNWRAGHHVFFPILFLFDDSFVIKRDKMDRTAILGSDNLSCFMINLLVDSNHHSHLEKLGNNV